MLNATLRYGILFWVFLPLFPAQAWSQQVVNADISFEFFVNGTLMPPDHYRISFDQMRGTMELQNSREQVTVLYRREDLQNRQVGNVELIFRKDGDRTVLHQVWIPGDTHVHDVVHSSSIPNV